MEGVYDVASVAIIIADVDNGYFRSSGVLGRGGLLAKERKKVGGSHILQCSSRCYSHVAEKGTRSRFRRVALSF